MRITLATYNIRRCVGRDGRFDPDRIVAVLREMEPDAIALQEVESRSVGGRAMLDHLARETGTEAIDGPTLALESGRYGNALLTRARIDRVRRIDLSVQGFEQRGAIHADLSWPAGRMQIVCTHLGLRAHERRWQAARILDQLRERQDGEVAALVGDFNEWNPWAGALRRIHARLGRSRAPASFPSVFPVLSLDRIWVTPRSAIERIETHDSRRARWASDHLPLRASLVL